MRHEPDTSAKPSFKTLRVGAIGAIAAVVATMASVAGAQTPLPVPTVEYSADRIVQSSAGTFTGKIYATPDKERADTQMTGVETVMITRRDKDVSWNVMPAQKMYMETDVRSAREHTAGMSADVTIAEVGPETVEGIATSKYKLLMKDGKAGGFMWFTAEGIMVKMDAVQKEGKESSRITMTLKNVQIGPQDPQLFEVPSDYTKMAGGMAFGGFSKGGGLKGAMKGGLGGVFHR